MFGVVTQLDPGFTISIPTTTPNSTIAFPVAVTPPFGAESNITIGGFNASYPEPPLVISTESIAPVRTGLKDRIIPEESITASNSANSRRW